MVSRVLVCAVSVVALSAVSCFALTEFDDLQTTRWEGFELPFMDQGEVPQFDILFVVDRPTQPDEIMWTVMGDAMLESANVPSALGGWDGATIGPPGGQTVELHIGVITSDLGAGFDGFGGCDLYGDDGILRSDVLPSDQYGEYHCGALADGDKFIRVIDGLVTNMEGVDDVGSAVQCLVLAQMTRTTTCPIKQPFRAVERALADHRDIANASFLQPEGGLAVVFISGEDDCSADDFSVYDPSLFGPYHCFSQGLTCVRDGNVYTDCSEPAGGALMATADLASLLSNAKGDNMVVVSVMAGPYDAATGVEVDEVPDLGMQIQPTCAVAGGGLEALPAVRLSLLKDRFADSALFQEICAPDSGQFFDGVARKLAAQTAYRCMPKVPVDDDSAEPGIQARCEVFDVVNPDELEEKRYGPYPECRLSGYGVTCWEMMPEHKCTAGYKLVLQRPPGDDMESQNLQVEVDCLVHIEDPR